jgi:hypothetical protein
MPSAEHVNAIEQRGGAHAGRALRAGPARTSTRMMLRREQIASPIDVVRKSDAVLMAISVAAPGMVELALKPAISETVRFGVVTLARRERAPALPIVRRMISQLIHD